MSLNNYIESLTKIDKTKSTGNVNWAKVVKEKTKPKPSSFRGRGVLPVNYQLELEKNKQSTSCERDQKYYTEGKETNSYETYKDSGAKYSSHRFADIIPSVREIGGGYNTFSNYAIETRIKENKLKHSSTEESDLSTTYTTATSKSAEKSFNTARETLESLKLSDDEASSSKNKRYRKNALMAKLIEAQNNKSYASSDVSSEWDNDASDEQLYEERISRFVQSTLQLVPSAEDEDVLVHPLKEEIKNDPEWQKYQLQRKGVQVVQTARQFYLELDDEDFNFEPRESA